MLQENIDFYYDHNGLMVLTKDFLLKRGKCCNSGCVNCPYTPKENTEETQKNNK